MNAFCFLSCDCKTGTKVMLEKQGRLSQALDLLTKSVKYSPKHAASWTALARLHQRMGRVEEARFCFSSAVEEDPRSYVALQVRKFR